MTATAAIRRPAAKATTADRADVIGLCMQLRAALKTDAADTKTVCRIVEQVAAEMPKPDPSITLRRNKEFLGKGAYRQTYGMQINDVVLPGFFRWSANSYGPQKIRKVETDFGYVMECHDKPLPTTPEDDAERARLNALADKSEAYLAEHKKRLSAAYAAAGILDDDAREAQTNRQNGHNMKIERALVRARSRNLYELAAKAALYEMAPDYFGDSLVFSITRDVKELLCGDGAKILQFKKRGR